MLTPENMLTHILDKKLRPTTAKHAEGNLIEFLDLISN